MYGIDGISEQNTPTVAPCSWFLFDKLYLLPLINCGVLGMRRIYMWFWYKTQGAWLGSPILRVDLRQIRQPQLYTGIFLINQWGDHQPGEGEGWIPMTSLGRIFCWRKKRVRNSASEFKHAQKCDQNVSFFGGLIKWSEHILETSDELLEKCHQIQSYQYSHVAWFLSFFSILQDTQLVPYASMVGCLLQKHIYLNYSRLKLVSKWRFPWMEVPQ